LLAARIGGAAVLAAGTALAGLGYCLAGASSGFAMLVGALAIGGIGASTQHPIASSIVARAYAGPRSLKALGGYNFAGDIGKMTIPAAVAFMLTLMAWRPTLMIAGLAGFAAAAAIFLLTPRMQATDTGSQGKTVATGSPRGGRWAFSALLTIGVLDSATRMGFLTFLPFLLQSKGADLPLIGIALTLVFAGGAAGKLVCAFVGARIGVVATVLLTEILTVAGILLLLPVPLFAAMALLPLIGIALNGTSSVLYGSVPDLVEPEKCDRAFGVFYTGTIGAGAIAPFFFGMAGDMFGVINALIVVALTPFVILPLTLPLRSAFASR
jgi:MFS family permease